MQKNRQNRESGHRAALARWVGAMVASGAISLSVARLLRGRRRERCDRLDDQERQRWAPFS